MKRKILLLLNVALIVFSINTLCVADGLVIDVPNTHGVRDAVITMDCYVSCGNMDSANFYICFDNAELSFLGLFQNDIPDIEYESGFRILSNVANAPSSVDKSGMIGIVIYNESGLAKQNFFNDQRRLFTIQFKVLKAGTGSLSLDYSGSKHLRTAVMSDGMAAEWRGKDSSGSIVLLEEIGDGNTLTLPSQVKLIEEEAFMGSGVNSVVVPAGLDTIKARAFADCMSLKDVHLPDTLSYIAQDAFINCPELIIYCASGSRAEDFAKVNHIPYVLLED